MQREDVVKVELNINGKPVVATTDSATTLQACLHHEMGFKEVRYGCGEGVCGACTVLIDGEPRASCLLLAVQAEGKSIITSSGYRASGISMWLLRLRNDCLRSSRANKL
jgi:aerobic-type carbon monoxide dehydrogenase small subunit (CoxS/CutS family)